MATGKKKAAPKRASTGGERTVVYRGIKTLPIYGRTPSATARAIRYALRMKSK